MKKSIFVFVMLWLGIFVPIHTYAQETGTNETVYTIVEEMPSYPGGNGAMTDYLKQNLKYPDKAKAEGIEGKVFVTFVVDKQGKVTATKILRGISPEIDAEALRVVSSMPNWNPGKQSGEAVAVQYNLPLNFTLQSKEKKNDE